MAKHLPVYLLLLVFPLGLLYSQDTGPVTKLRQIVSEKGQAEVTMAFPGKKEIGLISKNVSIGSIRDKTVHIFLSRRTVEWFIQQKYSFSIVERTASKGLTSSSSLEEALQWETYPLYSQYESIMERFALLYPSLCHLDTIGTSIKGKLVLALKISDNAEENEDEPEVFYTSSMHGDEVGGYILMLRLIDYLLQNYQADPRVTRLVDDLEIWINPLANPDGTYRNADGTYGNGDIMINPERANSNETDLNRNFPDPAVPGQIVEKENADMIRFMRKHNFILSANFHSGAELVNYPWDSRSRLHADDSWFYRISRKYADSAQYYSAPAYYMRDEENGVVRGIVWYQIFGGRMDFVTYELHGREITVELDNDFITPASELASLWQYNYRSLLGYLENALYGIHGRVTDALTSKPVPAKIFIRQHDMDSSQVYSDTLTGRFVRMLSPGSWDLLITAGGYRDTLVKNLLVEDNRKLTLNIKMKASASHRVPAGAPALIYPNPSASLINIMVPEDISGKVRITIFSQSGVEISDYYSFVNQGIPIQYSVGNLAAGVYNIHITSVLTGSSCTGRFIVFRK